MAYILMLCAIIMGFFKIVKMRPFRFMEKDPQILEKETVRLFDKDIPLRIIKGKISGYDIKTWRRYFDKDGNIQRYGDGMDDTIVRHEDYKQLELYLKTIHVDGYGIFGPPEHAITLYFERETLFDELHVGNTTTYFGLLLEGETAWLDYFLYNHNNNHITNLYFADSINERLFGRKYNRTELASELERGIYKISIK